MTSAWLVELADWHKHYIHGMDYNNSNRQWHVDMVMRLQKLAEQTSDAETVKIQLQEKVQAFLERRQPPIDK